MSRPNWSLVLNNALRLPGDEEDTKQAVERRPFQWVCANRLCRSRFMRSTPQSSEYCPQCLKHLSEGRPDLMDPFVYAECQKIVAQEASLAVNSAEYKAFVHECWVEGRRRPDSFNPEAAWRAFIGLPPKRSDYELDVVQDFKHLPITKRPVPTEDE